MERLALVFFVYGVAFFSVGLAIAPESPRPRDPLLGRPPRPPGGPATVAPALRILRLMLFAASTVALAQFGADVLASIRPRAAAVRWVPLTLIVFWTINWTVLPHLTGGTG